MLPGFGAKRLAHLRAIDIGKRYSHRPPAARDLDGVAIDYVGHFAVEFPGADPGQSRNQQEE